MEFLLIGLLVVFVVVSGPIAFVWCAMLQSRLNDLERDNARLRSLPTPFSRRVEDARSEDAPDEIAPEFIPEPEPEIAPEPEPEPDPEPVPVTDPIDETEWEKVHTPQPLGDDAFSWQAMELLIGRKVLGWVAVVAFVLSATFFIKLAVEEGWIGRIPPALKVFGIAAFGGAFLVAGKVFARIGWRRFSTMLSSAGIIIVYQAGYASYAFYDLIPVSTAGVVMTLIVLGSFLLSWHYGSKLLGVISILGGLAVPVLLATEVDRYPEFFTYLIILNVGTVMLVNLLRRAPIACVAFFGTQAEFWLWYNGNYAPEKLGAVLIFQGLFYLVYWIDTTLASTLRREKAPPTWDDAARAVLSPIILFGTIWLTLHNHAVLADRLGVFAFIGAAWYALLAVLYGRRLRRLWDAETDRSLSAYWKAGPTAATVLSLAFVAIAVPLQFDAAWFALGWTAVFAGLWYFGNRQENRAFVVLSYVFGSLGLLRLIHDLLVTHHAADMLPVFNTEALPPLAVVAVVLITAVLVDRLLKPRDADKTEQAENATPSARDLNFFFGTLAYFFLAVILTIETLAFFQLRTERFPVSERWAPIAVTVLWTLLAGLLLQIGVAFRSPWLRNLALTGFLITAVKMFGADLPTRAGAELGLLNPLGIGLVIASLLYIAVAVQTTHTSPKRIGWSVVGVIGLVSLLSALSIECYQFFMRHPLVAEPPGETTRRLVALGTLSALWTLYGALLLTLGLSLRQPALRVCGALVFGAALLKVFLFELFLRPDFTTPILNPYCLTMFCPITVVLLAGVWTTRVRPLDDRKERDGFLVLGLAAILLLWGALSIECFQYFNLRTDWPDHRFLGSASLTVFWTLSAVVLGLLGAASVSKPLRVLAVVLLAVTILKTIAFDLSFRPGYTTPVFNAYALPLLVLAFAAIFVGTALVTRLGGDDNRAEREACRVLALAGVVFLWLVLSLECFKVVRILQDAPAEAWKAQMALSILWSAFGGALIFVGFIGRSSTLRWMAIFLFAATSTKVLIVDMSGMHELYRFGAFFVLAVFLTLAAWAYQRFKPDQTPDS